MQASFYPHLGRNRHVLIRHARININLFHITTKIIGLDNGFLIIRLESWDKLSNTTSARDECQR